MNRILAPLRSLALPLLSTGAAALLASGCTQPPVSCNLSAAMPYTGKYQLGSGGGSGPCSELSGDALGFAAYNSMKPEGAPDLSQVSMAVRTTFLGSLVAHAAEYGIGDETDGHAPHAFGAFESGLPDANGICRPAELSQALQEIPVVPADEGDPADPEDDIPEQPATSVTETWTDVEVYVTAANPGTQMRGHYAVEQDGCSAEYEVLAVFPQVYCGDEDMLPDQDEDDDNEPDGAFCNAEAHPQLGYGSGISPDYPVVCDPVMLFCVLDAAPGGDFPVLR
jgi:hypothetical protein